MYTCGNLSFYDRNLATECSDFQRDRRGPRHAQRILQRARGGLSRVTSLEGRESDFHIRKSPFFLRVCRTNVWMFSLMKRRLERGGREAREARGSENPEGGKQGLIGTVFQMMMVLRMKSCRHKFRFRGFWGVRIVSHAEAASHAPGRASRAFMRQPFRFRAVAGSL